MELQLDLSFCDPVFINSPEDLTIWAALLAEHIGMTLHGDPWVENFGEGELAGWTVYQPITTSNITVHAVTADNSAFVNVFSCRPFDAQAAIEFTVKMFGAQAQNSAVRERRAPLRWSS